MPIVSVIEIASYFHARYSWPDARARIGNLHRPFHVFCDVDLVGGAHANRLIKDEQRKKNGTFGRGVIIVFIADFAKKMDERDRKPARRELSPTRVRVYVAT